MSNVISPLFRKEILDGNNKVVYEGDAKGIFILYYKSEDLNVGKIKTFLSAKLFSVLTACGVSNHFLCSNGVLEHKVLALDMLPFKFVVHSVVNEKVSKSFFLKPGLKLNKYLIEITLGHSDACLISKEHLVTLGILPESLIEELFSRANRIMDIVFSFFQAIDITVFSLSLSFGKRYKDNGSFDILLGDELSFKNIGMGVSSKLDYNLDDMYFKIAEKLNFDIRGCF